MQVVGIVGESNTGKTTLVERLAERLSDRGQVGTIKHLPHHADVDTEGKDTARHRAAGAAVTYGVTDDDDWFATGADLDLAGALDRLAPRVDYALVEGYTHADLPQVVLGDREAGEDVIARAPSADDVDVESLVDEIDALDPYETLESLVAEVKTASRSDRAGAIATFTGRVRRLEDPDDEPTEYLEFERYDEVAAERQAELRAELEAREGVYDVRLHHKTGVVPAGEDIVFVVVLAGHRAEAFEAVQDGIDRLKAEVPIFKKEVTVGDATWAHER